MVAPWLVKAAYPVAPPAPDPVAVRAFPIIVIIIIIPLLHRRHVRPVPAPPRRAVMSRGRAGPIRCGTRQVRTRNPHRGRGDSYREIPGGTGALPGGTGALPGSNGLDRGSTGL